MPVYPREMLMHVVHTHFEALVASWLHSQHDPEREMLVVRMEQTDATYSCHGEFWSLEEIDRSLEDLENHSGILRHDLFMQGLERRLPMMILLPGTVLPAPSPAGFPFTSARTIA